MELHIGYTIKQVMIQKQMAQFELAEKIGMHVGSISRIFNQSTMQTDLLKKFCIILQYDFFAHFTTELKLETEEVKASTCEKLLTEKTIELESLKKEMTYINEINDLLRKK